VEIACQPSAMISEYKLSSNDNMTHTLHHNAISTPIINKERANKRNQSVPSNDAEKKRKGLIKGNN
jgi:hypothetical protein